MPASLLGSAPGVVVPPIGASVAGAADGVEPLVGREAISTPLAGKLVNVDVPPGRYWPAGEVMRTVAAADGAARLALAVEAAGMADATGGIAELALGELWALIE
jgi:hypothetical protein